MEPKFGATARSRSRSRSRNHQYHYGRSSDRFVAIFQYPVTASSTPSFELTEHEIFDIPSESSSPTPTPISKSNNQVHNHNNSGILAALPGGIGDFKTRSNTESGAVFNHKVSTSASLASSTCSSPASSQSSPSSRIMIPSIPKRPVPVTDKMRFYHQSAPVNVPILSAAMQRRQNEFFSVVDDVEEEEEEEEEEGNREVVPPHEMAATKNSPVLASSVLEGAGRTLKGRDLRQVRNAVWRKTGFID